jgi:hypothetical protein
LASLVGSAAVVENYINPGMGEWPGLHQAELHHSWHGRRAGTSSSRITSLLAWEKGRDFINQCYAGTVPGASIITSLKRILQSNLDLVYLGRAIIHQAKVLLLSWFTNFGNFESARKTIRRAVSHRARLDICGHSKVGVGGRPENIGSERI